MRCCSCDSNLSDLESSRKDSSGHYIDLCNHCFNTVADDFIGVKETDDLGQVIDDTEDIDEFPEGLVDDELFHTDDN